MKTIIWWIMLCTTSFCIGFILADNGVGKWGQTETLDTHINLILPATERDFKKQLLYNSCQQQMLKEMERLGWLTKLPPEKVEDQSKEKGVKKGGK